MCRDGLRQGRALGVGEQFQGWRCVVKREPLLPQILSRGQIVSVNREPRKTLTSVSVFVDHHLAPSFYFVAFYYHRGLPVANSLQVDVQPKACEGKVTGIGRDGIVCWGLREKEEKTLSPF